MVLVGRGEEDTLRSVAARRCFGDVALTQLRMLAKEFGLDVSGDASLVGVLIALLKSSLEDLRPNELIAILSRRLRQGDPWENFLDMEFGLDSEVLDDPVHREWREELEGRADEEAEFKKQLETEVEGLRPKAPKLKRAKARTKPKFTDNSRDVELQKELPPGWRIWGDTTAVINFRVVLIGNCHGAGRCTARRSRHNFA